MKDKRKASVVILLNNDNNILVLKRAPGIRSFPEKWNFPGGKVEDGESIKEGGARELKEETGLSVKEKDLVYFQAHALPSIIIHYFLTNKWSGDVNINDESTDWKWVSLDDLDKLDFIPMPIQIINDIKYYMRLLND